MYFEKVEEWTVVIEDELQAAVKKREECKKEQARLDNLIEMYSNKLMAIAHTLRLVNQQLEADSEHTDLADSLDEYNHDVIYQADRDDVDEIVQESREMEDYVIRNHIDDSFLTDW